MGWKREKRDNNEHPHVNTGIFWPPCDEQQGPSQHAGAARRPRPPQGAYFHLQFQLKGLLNIHFITPNPVLEDKKPFASHLWDVLATAFPTTPCVGKKGCVWRARRDGDQGTATPGDRKEGKEGEKRRKGEGSKPRRTPEQVWGSPRGRDRETQTEADLGLLRTVRCTLAQMGG